jgi:hypothetical protein
MKARTTPKAELNGLDWTFVQSSTFVLLLNPECFRDAKNPPLRQAQKRYQAL